MESSPPPPGKRKKKSVGVRSKDDRPKKIGKKTSGAPADGAPADGAPKGGPIALRQSSSFEAIGCVSKPLVEALGLLGFTHCTPVQEATLPLLLPPLSSQKQQQQQQQQKEIVAATKRSGDLAVEAPTGSGKTLAFLIPAVSRLLQHLLQQQQHQQGVQEEALQAALTETPEETEAAAAAAAESTAAADDGAADIRCRLGALVVGPTRELCCQTHAVLQQLLSALERVLLQQQEPTATSSSRFLLRGLRITGGSRTLEADGALITKKCSKRGVYVLCATPGRLLSLLELPQQQQPLWDWRGLNLLVVDEADRLLDEQHVQQLQQLHAAAAAARQQRLMPAERREQPRLQTAFFSATLSSSMQQQIIKSILREPVCVRVTAGPLPTGCLSPSRVKEEGASDEPVKGVSPTGAVRHSVPATLKNAVVAADYKEKLPFLFKFIQQVVIPQGRRCIVFCLTCQCVDYYFSLLQEGLQKSPSGVGGPLGKGGPVQGRGAGGLIEKLHGRMKQRARTAALSRFCSSSSSSNSNSSNNNNNSSNNNNKGALVLVATDVAARGIDFPDVQWILQLDPPQNPEVFVHRIGRTARAGRGGTALLLLLPHEDAYKTFLMNRGVALSPFKETPEGQQMQQAAAASTAAAEGDGTENQDVFVSEAEIAHVNQALKEAVEQDQALIQKSTRAFVSFIRAYKEHQLSFLLPFARLNLGRLATAMHLLRIPRMREVMGKSLKDFQQSSIDPATVPFRHDEGREKERQQQLDQLHAKREEQKKLKDRRRLEEEKKEKQLLAGISKQKRTTSEKRHAKKQNALDEWQELAFEERLARKLRRGRITEEDYDRLIEKGPQNEKADVESDLSSDSCPDTDDSDIEEERTNRKETRHSAITTPKATRKPSWALKRGHRKKRRR